jgi:nucleoside-diphosphate-sugar epimerase
MRVLVTGAAGFIGSHLTRLLVSEGCDVVALVRPNSDLRRLTDVCDRVTLLRGDVLSPRTIESDLHRQPPDLCFHLAWFISPGTHPNSLRNIEFVSASMDLLQVLDRAGCARTVITGTCLEQDPSLGCISEQTRIAPQNFYAACKHSLHIMAESFQRRQGRQLVWARLFNTYGPWEYEGPLVPDLVARLLNNQHCLLTEGNQKRDYLHVEDVASALWTVARSTIAGAVNIGNSEPVAVATIAKMIAAHLGRTNLLRFGARPPSSFDCPFCCASTEYLRSATNWVPRKGLEEGLLQTIRWWKEAKEGIGAPHASMSKS